MSKQGPLVGDMVKPTRSALLTRDFLTKIIYFQTRQTCSRLGYGFESLEIKDIKNGFFCCYIECITFSSRVNILARKKHILVCQFGLSDRGCSIINGSALIK